MEYVRNVMKKNGKEEKNIEPIKLTKKEIKELQKQFPELEEKASLVGIAVMIFELAMLGLVLYYLYLTLTYQV